MAALSPLGSMASSRSPDSFYTAKDDSDTAKSTAASSPLQGASASEYRDARPLPRELKQHCQIFLEEQLYVCAINLLNSVLGSGASTRKSPSKPVPVPPPSHLALLNTLIVHPLHTTRVEKPEHLDASCLALDYLRNLLITVGPINADLRTAFRFFSPMPRMGRRAAFASSRGHDYDAGDSQDADSDGDEDRLQGRLANESSVWGRGQDFWTTIGWAFNCSILHPHRWRYWKVWLEFMLDVLEADWEERERLDLEEYSADGCREKQPMTRRQESLIQAYMDQTNGRQGGFKGMVKALLADGGSMSSLAFPEVFDKEPRGPKHSKKRKREQVLDLDNDRYGDYFDDDSVSSGASEPPTPPRARGGRATITKTKTSDDDSASTDMVGTGMAEAVTIRLRLFKLLSAVTFASCHRKELIELYEIFAAAIKLLPLPSFAVFVSQRTNPLLPETHITILKELFHLLLPSSYKDPRKVDPEADATGDLTMLMLEHCFTPYPANSVSSEDNAKLSLVVEAAMQLLWVSDILEYTESFASAVETGITARDNKVKKRKTGKAKLDPNDVLAQAILANSAARIRVQLEVMKMISEGE